MKVNNVSNNDVAITIERTIKVSFELTDDATSDINVLDQIQRECKRAVEQMSARGENNLVKR